MILRLPASILRKFNLISGAFYVPYQSLSKLEKKGKSFYDHNDYGIIHPADINFHSSKDEQREQQR